MQGIMCLQMVQVGLRHVMQRVEQLAQARWPGSFVAGFGSQATFLALPGSDLDVVVLGVLADDTMPDHWHA